MKPSELKALLDAARDISDRGILGAGKLDAIESGLIGALVEALVAYDEAQVPPSDAIYDDTQVICPGCSHHFRAIPPAVQKELRELRRARPDAAKEGT